MHENAFGVETMTNEGLAEHDKHCDTDDVHRVFKWCKEEGFARGLHYDCGPQEPAKKRYWRILRAVVIDPDYAAFAIYTPYPNTPTFERGAAWIV